MGSAAIRKKLHDYIDSADEAKLKAMYIVLQTDIEQNQGYSDALISKLHKRRDNHLKGLSKSYSVTETLAYARGKRK